jgi:hypothetical protein
MTESAIIDRLLDEHRQLRAIAGELSALLDRPEAPADDSVSDCRWRMARLALRHLPLEDRHVFRRLDQHPDPNVRAAMARYRREFEGGYAAYQQHSERWTDAAVRQDWGGYRHATRRQLAFLEERLTREEQDLYPHLASAPPAEGRTPELRNWAGDAWAIKASLGR